MQKWHLDRVGGGRQVGRLSPAPQAVLLRLAPAMTRFACARSSGVRASPKSSASNTGRISISHCSSCGLGRRLTVDRFLQRGDLPEPVADDQFVGLGERPINDQATFPEQRTRATFLGGVYSGLDRRRVDGQPGHAGLLYPSREVAYEVSAPRRCRDVRRHREHQRAALVERDVKPSTAAAAADAARRRLRKP
jgi:hypothetical protein